MRRIWVDFLLIALIGTALFAKVSSTYFCGFDDFSETRRVVFEDAGSPSRIFTTTHFGTTKYRPLNRLSTFLCWTVGGGSALPFRLRNLLFHLICALSVYAIALMWTRQRAVALVAGLFFCLDPATNQNVVATVFTNTSAYAFLLTGFLVFLVWAESKRAIWLALSLLLVLIGMFYYEPVIMVFPMMAGLSGFGEVEGQQQSSFVQSDYGLARRISRSAVCFWPRSVFRCSWRKYSRALSNHAA